jgi:hypothetical protein
MVERLIFSRRNGWLFDNEYRTDWSALNMSVPSYLDRDRDLLGWEVLDSPDSTAAGTPSTDSPTVQSAAVAKPHAFSSLSQSLSRMVFRQDDTASAAAIVPVPTTGAMPVVAGSTPPGARAAGRKPSKKVDRQYVFHNGLAVVRVAAQGFLWMQNTGSKVSDVNPTIEERRELVARNLAVLTQACEKVPLCYDICVDIVERAMEYAHNAQIAREVIDESVNDAFTELANKALLAESAPTPPAEVPSSPVPAVVSPAAAEAGHVPSIEASASENAVDSAQSAIPEPLVLDALSLTAQEPVYFTMTMDEEPSPAVPKQRSETAYSFLSTPTDTPHSATATPRSDLAFSGMSASVDPFPHMSASSDVAPLEGGMALSSSSSKESLSLSSVSPNSPVRTKVAQSDADLCDSDAPSMENA